MKSGDGKKAELWRFIKFNLVGVLNTAIDWVVYAILAAVGAPMGISQVIAYSAGVVNSYACNLRFTFKEKANAPLALRFIAANLVVLAISVALLQAAGAWGAGRFVAKLIITPVTLLLNYLLNRFWVFAKGTNKHTDKDEGERHDKERL